jgi:hypothetical protein
VLALVGYFCLDLLFIMNNSDFFHIPLTKIIFLVNFLSETCKLSQIRLSVLGQVLGKNVECKRVKMMLEK